MIAEGFCCICLMMAMALVVWGCWKAEQAMAEEIEREKLRQQTRNAMRTDKHLAKLKQQKMRVQYARRARVW